MRRIHSLLSLLVLSLIALAARGQDGAVEKPRLAIRDIAPTQPVLDAARVQGQGDSLRQILAAADSQLIDAVTATRRFDIVARADLATVLKEQDIAESGLIDPSDPQTARAFSMAGARYVATITVENFQEGVATAQFQGGLGETTMERRTVQLQATLKIYDTTSGVLLDSASLVIEDAEVRETLPGATQTGRLTNALLGTVATHLARDTANAIMDTLAPAKVLAYTMGQVTLNRGEGTGVAVGQVWQVFHAGQALVDPDTGEVLGSEEIPVGWVRITEVTPKFSKAQAIEDMGIVNGSILRFSRWDCRRTSTPTLGPAARRGLALRHRLGLFQPRRLSVPRQAREARTCDRPTVRLGGWRCLCVMSARRWMTGTRMSLRRW
jgi:curli biogenesis system outer membrane secretion channel CsgG